MLAAALAAAPAAHADIAKFRASIKGTYSQQGTVTDSQCWRSDDNDNATYFTGQGTSTENDTFASRKPITLTVSRTRGERTFLAGSFPQLQTVFTLNRTSNLAGTDTPPDCTPEVRNNPQPSDCGTKQRTYRLRVYGRTDRAAFSYSFTNGFTTQHPDDPFTGCFLAGGSVWPGQLQTAGRGPVSPRKLFSRRVRTIVVHGGDSGTTHPDPPVGGSGTYKLSWTLTLRRR